MQLSSVLGSLLLLGLCASLDRAEGLGLGRNGGEGNDYTWGAKATGDTLIAREIITRSKTLFQTTTRTYTLTQAGTAKTISYIHIRDLKLKRGATAEVTSGGVGDTTVTITFTSVRGGAIKSQIEIWGQ